MRSTSVRVGRLVAELQFKFKHPGRVIQYTDALGHNPAQLSSQIEGELERDIVLIKCIMFVIQVTSQKNNACVIYEKDASNREKKRRKDSQKASL